MERIEARTWTIAPGTAFATIRVETWSQFSDLIETHFLDWSEYVYRGQRCAEWPLISKFDREISKGWETLRNADPYAGLDADDRALVEQAIEGKGKPTLPGRDECLKEHLESFKTAALGRRGASPKPLSDDEWWALGQHFGMATPLLDWTRSAYVACFFALEDPTPPRSCFRAVWTFSHFAHVDILINQPENYEKRREELRIIELIETPIDENNRMISQSGLFTRTPSGEDIASFIDGNVNLSGFNPILHRIEIPDRHRDLFLRHLELMNIHAGTLFPDLVGAAAIANRRLEKKTSRLLLQQTPIFLRNMLSDMPVHEGTSATERSMAPVKRSLAKSRRISKRKRPAKRT
ncbi:MAG: FRG domain-containing protein [Gammaproteobacteria bacterium]